MRMGRILFVCLIFCTIASNATAFDTRGKFGMGIRLWGTPIITFSNMTVGVSNLVGFEPSMGLYKWTDKYGSYESSNTMLILSVLANLKPVRAHRSNLVVKIGGLFGEVSSSYSSPWGESSTTYTQLALLTGIGIEHFVNDNFSVNVGALSGVWKSDREDSDTSISIVAFGNQLVDFSLVWYLK